MLQGLQGSYILFDILSDIQALPPSSAVSHCVQHPAQACPPLTVASRLCRQTGGWRFVESEFVVTNDLILLGEQ